MKFTKEFLPLLVNTPLYIPSMEQKLNQFSTQKIFLRTLIEM